MPISEHKNAFVDAGAVSIGISKMFSVTAAIGNPHYLVLTMLDRNEYTAGATDATGTLTGNGHTLSLISTGGDARGNGIVFTYQSSSGRYFNASYGYFDRLIYNASVSADDVADISLFGTGSLPLANAYATNAYDMMQVDAAGYLGTATVVTQPDFSRSVPTQATPASIAATAEKFVGRDWNVDGCWVLCSSIAADAGAALPMQSTLIGLAGAANGEWIVVFDGAAGQSGNWQPMVRAGEMVVFGTPGGGGHITTVVSGAGGTAMVVDNAVVEGSGGTIANPANGGSSSDIRIQPPHLASQEWVGVQADTVVIYELDTPVVTDTVASDTLAIGKSQSLASLFAAIDPAGHAITDWQVYNSLGTDVLVAGGKDYTEANSAASAISVKSLAAVSLLAGAAVGTDTLEVRASNGSYWGDWQSLPVTITGTNAMPPPIAMPPALEPPPSIARPGITMSPTASQLWTDGQSVELQLPANTFTDALGLPMRFTAFEIGGPNVTGWLYFDPTKNQLAGQVPASIHGTVELTVIATDALHMTAEDLFSVTIGPGPGHTPFAATDPAPGMGLLFDPPEPANALPLHF